MATGSETPKPQITTGATRHAMAQVKERIPERSDSKYWANIEKKKGIKFPKTIGNRKGDCAVSCSR